LALRTRPRLARLLLSLGADPNIRDANHHATPLGWAEYGDQQPLIELLTPLTDDAGSPQEDSHADADN
jgi:hypothetical protein